MSGSDKRRPPGIEYGQLNPEAINSDIRLVRFTPISTITQSRGGDVIRFQIANDGFMDPLSTYIRMSVECVPALGEIRFLDRSAHSFISRLVIRSNGVEIERIENYDVIAAMINDMMYNPSQMAQHHWEGFPGKLVDIDAQNLDLNLVDAEGKITASNEAYKLMRRYFQYLCPGSSTNNVLVGEHAFWSDMQWKKGAALDSITTSEKLRDKLFSFAGTTYSSKRPNAIKPNFGTGDVSLINHLGYKTGFYYNPFVVDVGGTEQAPEYVWGMQGNTRRDFIMPIYSGFMGILMPIKKFIPLMALPLDIEFTLNQYALYSSHSTAESGSRQYTVTRFEIMSHVLFFDSDVNFYLENTIANYGLYLHCNSFALAPVTGTSDGNTTVPPTIQIGLSHKSINSIHFLFYYQSYENQTCQRKLHFVSHNVRKMQIRNGPFYLPSEPLMSTRDMENAASDTYNYAHIHFLIELYKAWGKMHDPKTDSLINETNWGSDVLGIQGQSMAVFCSETIDTPNSVQSWKAPVIDLIAKQGHVGRTQYAINFEGEELGEDKTLISGRAARTPFDLQLTAAKSLSKQSYSNIFIRHDYIVQIRPDLVIQVAGR